MTPERFNYVKTKDSISNSLWRSPLYEPTETGLLGREEKIPM